MTQFNGRRDNLTRVSDLVINVEVPLALILAHHPRLLQEEVGDFATIRLAASAELNLKIFSLVERKSEDVRTNRLCVEGDLANVKKFYKMLLKLNNIQKIVFFSHLVAIASFYTPSINIHPVQHLFFWVSSVVSLVVIACIKKNSEQNLHMHPSVPLLGLAPRLHMSKYDRRFIPKV